MVKALKDLVIKNWRTSLKGAVEGTVLGGVGVALDDPQALKMALLLAAWRFIKGLLTLDTLPPPRVPVAPQAVDAP